jgi:alpha-L-fucosidase
MPMYHWLCVVLGLGIIGAAVSAEARAAPKKPYEAKWQSLKQVAPPAWFEDGKFGIMIHWGVYSVPGWVPHGYAEWYPHKLYRDTDSNEIRQYHERRFGKLPDFGYKDFVPRFKAQRWDPGRWARLFKKAGARYVIAVGEHHDGFAMWDSDLTTWDAKEQGPKRDIIGQLAQAVRREGMRYGVSYHRERHFAYYNKQQVMGEIKKVPEAAELYGPFDLSRSFIEDYVARWKEIQRKYKPAMMWLDDVPAFRGDHPNIPLFKQACKQMIADYLNTATTKWHKPVYLNNKSANWPEGIGCHSADNLQLDAIPDDKWENPATISHSYGYNRDDEKHGRYKSATQLIHLLVDVVSKNGNLLLNVGPKADGTIPAPQKQRLRAIGDWLQSHGEAIYGTRPWKTFGRADIRYTTKGQTLYAISFTPRSTPFTLPATAGWMPTHIKAVSRLNGKPVDFAVTDQGLKIQPEGKADGKHAWVYKIQCAEPLDALPARMQ